MCTSNRNPFQRLLMISNKIERKSRRCFGACEIKCKTTSTHMSRVSQITKDSFTSVFITVLNSFVYIKVDSFTRETPLRCISRDDDKATCKIYLGSFFPFSSPIANIQRWRQLRQTPRKLSFCEAKRVKITGSSCDPESYLEIIEKLIYCEWFFK